MSNMRILHIGKYFPPFNGGLENYMRDAMVALGRHGIGSAALVHRHSLSLTTRHETFSAAGHTFPVIRTGRWARLIFAPISPAFPWHFRRLIKTFKPDILHLHLPNPSVFWALLLPSARRVPWVVHWHADVITASQNWQMKLFYRLYRPFERAVLKRAKAIVVTSAPYRDSSTPLQPWLDKCHVVPLGVDTERFVGGVDFAVGGTSSAVGGISSAVGGTSFAVGGTSFAGRDCFTDQTIAMSRAHPSYMRILAVGRLTYYKGFRFLIEAAAKVSGIHIDLVGHGDQMKELKALATSLNIRDRVSFHGLLTDGELAQHMLKADCICLPSIERTEAFGLVLLEAMYFGKATVVSDVPGSGMGWIIDDGITGLKVAPADADALAAAFTWLSTNRAELARMGERGKQKFEQQFEINHAIEGIMEVYQQIIPAHLSKNGEFSSR